MPQIQKKLVEILKLKAEKGGTNRYCLVAGQELPFFSFSGFFKKQYT